jgi:hypothetical protein
VGECQETYSGSWADNYNGSRHSSQGSAALKEAVQIDDTTALGGDEEGRIVRHS